MFHLVCNVDDHVKVCKEGTQTHILRRESEEDREREKDNAWIGFEVESHRHMRYIRLAHTAQVLRLNKTAYNKNMSISRSQH